jgi:AcrR family transcriptional regulator
MKGERQPIYRKVTRGRTPRFDAKLVHLLTRAARAFAEQGYEKTSIRQVARKAGVSLAGLYYYVGSKEELLFLIQYHTFKVLTESLSAVLEQYDSPIKQLRRMVENHIRYLVEHLPELKVCTTELDSLKGRYYKRVLSLRQRYFEMTRGILSRLGAQGRNRAVADNLATLYLFGMLNWIVMWFDPERNDPAELAETLLTLFLRGYGGLHKTASRRGRTSGKG